mmetsp:Transcript_78977/g.183213  ORF Transcript_78977/g.183213 Transcript_78977/m.183213 type:complete len:216 (-) Transcript_78977:104-751(-)
MMDQHRSGPSCYHLEVKNTHHCKKMQCQEAPLHQLASSGLPEGLHLRAHQRAASNGTSHPAMHKQQADGEEKTRSTHSGVGTLMKSWQGAAQFAGRQDMCSQGCHSSAPQVPNRCRNLLNIFTSSWKPPSLRKSGLPVSAPTSIALVATKTISWVSMLVHDSPRLELASGTGGGWVTHTEQKMDPPPLQRTARELQRRGENAVFAGSPFLSQMRG